MVRLEYWDGQNHRWIPVSVWENETLAWVSLGRDHLNYRTVDIETNKVLTSLKITE